MGKPKDLVLQTKRRSARLVLTISHQEGEKVESQDYTIRPLEHQMDREFARCWQIDKKDGNVYHVTQELDGKLDCDCGDKTFREGKHCKHILALKAFELFLNADELKAIRRARP